jgi:hypothetical protein
MGQARMQRAAELAAMLLLGAAACAAEHNPPAVQPLPPGDGKPAVRIEVAPLGYQPPSTFYLTSRFSSATLGFFDDTHLLFTFRVGGLLKRTPQDRPYDNDQQIRALVLDLTTGKVANQADWRMYDRGAYLWPYPAGKFLVRIRDSLYLTDSSLRLQPYIAFPQGLREVEVSPDRSLTVLETNLPEKPQTQGYTMGGAGQMRPVKVLILPSGSKDPIAESDSDRTVMIPLMPDAILNVLEGTKQELWVMQEVPFHGKPRLVAGIQSTCRPAAQPLSARVVLMTGCDSSGSTRPVRAISSDGRQLWQDRWESRYIWGWFDYAENGSRFAYESIRVTHPTGFLDPLSPSDVAAQMVGVYDTETGKLVLVKDASPVLAAGQNVSLSPDGMRFAILRNGAVEVYDLPPVTHPAPEATPTLAKRKPDPLP